MSKSGGFALSPRKLHHRSTTTPPWTTSMDPTARIAALQTRYDTRIEQEAMTIGIDTKKHNYKRLYLAWITSLVAITMRLESRVW